MAYCKKCGAYIPDGQETCLACGYSEAAEKAKEKAAQNSASATAYAPRQKSEEELREDEVRRARAEERRRQQQEMNRKWAEAEQLRRQQQEDFRRSQEEAARRAREQEFKRTLNEDGYATLHRNAPYGSSGYKSGTSNRTLAYLSYISFLCFLPSLLGVDDAFTRFHSNQGRKLFFASLILSWIPFIREVVWLMQLSLTVIGIRNVNAGKLEKLPIVGDIGQ